MNQKTLLTVKNLSKRFGNQEVLHSISINVKQGQFVAIEGPSGSGKSTLLSVIGLLDMRWDGTYELSGYHVNKLEKSQLAKIRNKYVGWIFQNFNLIGDLNVLDNVMVPMRYGKFGSKSDKILQAKQVISQVGLNDKVDSFPHELSGGQQQRVAIARALVTQPSILLADEPTGNLDSHNATQIFSLLQALNKQGVTIVMVSHDSHLTSQCPIRIKMLDGVIIQSEGLM